MDELVGFSSGRLVGKRAPRVDLAILRRYVCTSARLADMIDILSATKTN